MKDRFYGQVLLILVAMLPSIASAQIFPPYVPPAPQGTLYQVPWNQIRPLARWHVRADYQRQAQQQQAQQRPSPQQKSQPPYISNFVPYEQTQRALQTTATKETQNFRISAPAGIITQLADAAESFRKSLALEWIGTELTPWQGKCMVRVVVGDNLGAGGTTSFAFNEGTAFGFDMQIQGNRERLLDSVLPHEILHTVFATHFGRPLPRWADEGACSTVEHESEQTRHNSILLSALRSRPTRGYATNVLFAATEYPRDILPFYAQGHSYVSYFLEQGGKRKFIDYLSDGMNSSWTEAGKKHYDFDSLSHLQENWLRWFDAGSPYTPNSDLVSVAYDGHG